MRRLVIGLLAAACVLGSLVCRTGSHRNSDRDRQGRTRRRSSGAIVRISSPALIGGPQTQTTNARGQLRFSALPSGEYAGH